MENATDEQLEHYVENDLDLWGIVNLSVVSLVEYSVQHIIFRTNLAAC
nr:hypothetical protein [Vibrio lentus]